MNNKNIFLEGLVEKNKGNYARSYEIFYSIKNDSLAKLELVFLLINGFGVSKNFNEAILLLKEIERDSSMKGAVCGLLGELYLYNSELKDLSKALECIDNGSKLGNATCLKLKADIFYYGIYGEINYEKSFNLYLEAAKKMIRKHFYNLHI